MQELVYLNGWTGKFDEAFISVNDRGYNFGDGVYEVIRAYNGAMFALDDHLQRLENSAAVIEMNLPMETDKLCQVTEDLLKQSMIKEAMVYMQISRGTAHRNHIYDPEMDPNLLITVRHAPETPASMYAEGVKIITIPEFRWQMCHVKSISLLSSVLAKNKAHRAGAAEAVFVLDDGTVTECSASNIFIYHNGSLITHPANNRILSGITRKYVLAAASKLGLDIKEEPFKLADMLTADEVFITGTIAEIVPVVDVDGKVIADGKPGSVTAKLIQAFADLR